MYALVAMLSFVAAGAYVHGVLSGRRLVPAAARRRARAHPLHAQLGAVPRARATWSRRSSSRATAGARPRSRRRDARALPAVAADAALAGEHTGAPWAIDAELPRALLAPGAVLSGDAPFMAIVLAGGAGLAAVVRRRARSERGGPCSRSPRVVGVTVARRVDRLADLAGVDDALLRGRRSGRCSLLSARGLVRAGRLGSSRSSLVFIWSNYACSRTTRRTRAQVDRRRRAVPPPGRPGALDAPGAGARAPPLPRAGLPVRDARSGPVDRRAGVRLATTRSKRLRAVAPATELERRARVRAAGAAPRRRLACVPRLPRVAGRAGRGSSA